LSGFFSGPHSHSVIGAARRKRCHIRRISVEGPLPAGLGGGDYVSNFFLTDPFLATPDLDLEV